MRRLQFIELHDLKACPKLLRNGLTAFLEISMDLLDTYGPIRRRLLEVMMASKTDSVVDLCSGAGGPWINWLSQNLVKAKVTLTDLFPNVDARERITRRPIKGLSYLRKPVDATNVPDDLKGIRTIFSGFHHFPPDHAAAIVKDAVSKGQPIGIFEVTHRSLRGLYCILLSPLGVLLLTPRMSNVSRTTWLFTYAIPLIPLIVGIDGVISCLRSYTVDELRSMATAGEYVWSIGVEKRWATQITYMTGYPRP